MEKESFEDPEVAKVLNQSFVAIKVDKEERPDVDSIYMQVCQMLTHSGGWPLTILLTSAQKPFFAGTYFPKKTAFGQPGLLDLLTLVRQQWGENQKTLLESAEHLTSLLRAQTSAGPGRNAKPVDLVSKVAQTLEERFDEQYGGFGPAPKFPQPHNLLFLLKYAEVNPESRAWSMVEKTLLQMYRGGIFDHIGFGFSRYSTDEQWLVPHFEKMLYDNTLLILTYTRAYARSTNSLFRQVAEKTIQYVLRELTAAEGAFFCAQDADSDGEEGKYYLFTPEEIEKVLGSEIALGFNLYYGIQKSGNFEGQSIPNLLANQEIDRVLQNRSKVPANPYAKYLEKVYTYRKQRYTLHKDDKVLAAWNGLMIVALAEAYLVFGDSQYLEAAQRAETYIQKHLTEGDRLFTSYRAGKRSENGFLEDYAYWIWACLALYTSTLEKQHLDRAKAFMDQAILDFYDAEQGGFFLYGRFGEQLILKPKECYDGALPSGNAVMVLNLFYLSRLFPDEHYAQTLEQQVSFLLNQTQVYPAGHSFFFFALLQQLYPPPEILCVLKSPEDYALIQKQLQQIPLGSLPKILEEETNTYPLLQDQLTYYVCLQNTCLPAVNHLEDALSQLGKKS